MWREKEWKSGKREGGREGEGEISRQEGMQQPEKVVYVPEFPFTIPTSTLSPGDDISLFSSLIPQLHHVFFFEKQ